MFNCTMKPMVNPAYYYYPSNVGIQPQIYDPKSGNFFPQPSVQNAQMYYDIKDYGNFVREYDRLEGTRKLPFVAKYFNNEDFKQLVNGKYFNTPEKFKNLVDIVYNLEKESFERYQRYYDPYYCVGVTPNTDSILVGVKVENCIENIRKLFDSNICEEEKLQLVQDYKRLTGINYSGVALTNLSDSTKSLSEIHEPWYI